MEQRIERLELEQREIWKHIRNLEHLGLARDLALMDIKHELNKANERLVKLDELLTEAHTELAELRIEHGKILQEHTEFLKLILEKLS